MHARQAGGGSTSGRYMKHDSARLRCLQRVIYPRLRMGILPSAEDARMLFDLPGPRDISGPAKKEMDVWSNMYARDPRSKEDSHELDTAGQTTLLLWAQGQGGRLTAAAAPAPRRGRPHALHTSYKLERGGAKIEGKTLDEVRRQEPWYLAWLLGALRYTDAFVWSFPRDELMFLALLEYEQNDIAVTFSERGEESVIPVVIPANIKNDFERDMLGGFRGARERRRREHDDRAVAETRDDDDADAPFEKLEAVDRTGNTVGAETMAFFNETMGAIKAGKMPALKNWKNYKIFPPHWTKVIPFNVNNAKTLPLYFWSPSEFWADVGVTCPCARHGWAHAGSVKVYLPRGPRLVKDGFGNSFGLCAARLYCGACAQERKTAKDALALAQDQDATEAELAALEKAVANATCWFSAITPSVTAFLTERYPFIAMEFPAFVTHRSAVSTSTLQDMLRAAKTSQGPHDLERKYDELASIRATTLELSVISYQATRLDYQRKTVAPRLELGTLDLTLAKISDTYIASTTRAYVESHEDYILNWMEQNVKRGEFAFGDHSGKHGSRMKLQGDSVLGWVFTEVNEIGQKVISVRVQTTSWNDPSLVAAYDARQRADQRLGRPNPLRRLCLDNPKKDGSGAIANVFLGQGLDVLRFEGQVILVRTELDCDNACATLEGVDLLGFDTENVAYIPPFMGQNINKAAIVQLATKESAFIFVVHEWERCYASFSKLMASDVEKVAVNVSHDVRMVLARFPEIEINGDVELASRVKAAHPNLESYGLASMSKHILEKHLDKRIEHHLWEASRYTPRQIMYAASDAYASLEVARALLSEGPQRDGPSTRASRRRFANMPTEPLTGPNLARIAAETTETDDVEDLGEVRVACTRHRARTGEREHAESESDGEQDDDDHDDLAVEEDCDDGDGGDARHARAEARARRRAADGDEGDLEAPEEVFEATKRRVSAYRTASRQDDMELPSSLSNDQRRAIHRLAEDLGLFHRSVGGAGDRRLVISAFAPPQSHLASVGPGVVLALVARDTSEGCVRGRVASFDGERCRWELQYSDGSTETVDVDLLNLRIRRRHDFDTSARGDAAAAPEPDGVGDDFRATELATLLGGVDPDWTTSKYSKLSYDIWHWMKNWRTLLAVHTRSELAKTFNVMTSEALFTMCEGEWERLVQHLKHPAGGSMTDDQIKKIRRSYKRKMCRYAVLGPDVLVRRLYDIYCLYDGMMDPERPGQRCFVSNAHDIMLKEMWYVRTGLLSDLPGVPMYRVVGRLATGLEVHRGRRTSSALEGQHLHWRQAQHPGAKHSGPLTTATRALLFDLSWNVRAAQAANLMPDIGHSSIWLVDMIFDVVQTHNLPKSCIPKLYQSWTRTDTSHDPLITWGVQWAALGLEGGKGALPSPLREDGEIATALANRARAEMVARGDVAGLERDSGLRVDARNAAELRERVLKRSRADSALRDHGAPQVWDSLRCGGGAVNSSVLRAPRPEMDLGAVGPLPFAAESFPFDRADANQTMAVDLTSSPAPPAAPPAALPPAPPAAPPPAAPAAPPPPVVAAPVADGDVEYGPASFPFRGGDDGCKKRRKLAQREREKEALRIRRAAG